MSLGLAAGSIVEVSEKDGEYSVTQVEESTGLPSPAKWLVGSRIEIEWKFGPVKVAGYLDTSTLEIVVTISIFGIVVRNFYGNLKNPLIIHINLFHVKGTITFYVKNKNELWVRLDLKVTHDGTFEGDYKILSW